MKSTSPLLRLEHPFMKTSLMLVVLGLDHWTKWLAQEHLRYRMPHVYAGGAFRLEYAENTGAFLSLGSALPENVRYIIFVIVVGIFLGLALFYLYFDRKLDRTTTFSLAMICSGGIGNLIDRIFRPNHGVVDFLNVGLGNLRTGIFNIADMAIMLGVILLAWKSIFPGKAGADEASAVANANQGIDPSRAPTGIDASRKHDH